MLRGTTPRYAGVKVVGDFVDNHRLGLPSELALLLLMDPSTGAPQAILDATSITEMRTGAMTAIGAAHLARRDSRVLGHIGARGTAYWNVRLTTRVLPQLERIRVHSRRRESREAFARRLRADLESEIEVTQDWESCVRGADVVVEASRLTHDGLHAELGEIVCGAKPGREHDAETILFWHRGLSITDVALGEAMLVKARERGIGTTLP